MPRPGHRPLRLALTFAAGCVGAALGLTVLALATAAFFRPDLGRPPVPPDPRAAAAARLARDPQLNRASPPQVWPRDFLQVPVTQSYPVTQSAFAVQVVLHRPVVVSQRRFPQATLLTAWQVPEPLQVRARFEVLPAAQEAATHTVGAG